MLRARSVSESRDVEDGPRLGLLKECTCERLGVYLHQRGALSSHLGSEAAERKLWYPPRGHVEEGGRLIVALGLLQVSPELGLPRLLHRDLDDETCCRAIGPHHPEVGAAVAPAVRESWVRISNQAEVLQGEFSQLVETRAR